MLLRHVGVWVIACLTLSSLHLAAFEDQNHVYTITFPEGWTVDESDSNNIAWVIARSPAEEKGNPFLENIQITYNQKASNTLLNEYLPDLLVFMKEKYADVEIMEIGSTELADRTAKWVLFTSQGPGDTGEPVRLKAIHYALVAGKHLMIILCVAPIDRFDASRPTFEKSLKTLKFLK